MESLSAERIRFGEFELDIRAGELRQGERRIRLQEQPLQILLMLLEHPGQVVTREAICERLWPNDTVVEFDHSIGTAIKKLRQALGDEAENPRYVETLPRRGFRFIFPDIDELRQPESRELAQAAAPARPVDDGASVAPSAAVPQEATRPRGRSAHRYRASVLGAAACLVCGLVLLAWHLRRRPADAAGRNFDESTLTQITSSTGLDMDPSLSPDASAVAYSSNQNGSFEIYVKSLTPGGRDLQLTNDGQQNYQPAWSPDGKFIAYYSQKQGGIWVTPALGGTAHQIVDFGSHPAWSPDGTKIAFQSDPTADISQVSYAATPPSSLWVVPSPGGTPTQITQPGDPAGGHGAPSWSPDGKRIAFSTTSTSHGQIWSVPADGGQPMRLVPDRVYDPTYSPDGRFLYYQVGWTSSFTLMRVPLSPDGHVSGPQQRVADTGQVLYKHLSFSADGRAVAFSGLRSVNNIESVMISPSTGLPVGAPFPVTHDTSVRKTHPMFSPDGSKLAFALLQVGEQYQLIVCTPDGRDQRPLAQMWGTYTGWFPDSRHIAVREFRDGSVDIESVDVGSGSKVLLRKADQFTTAARLSPDGKQIAFSGIENGTINVWTMPVDGDTAKQLTFDKEAASFPVWSHDGRFIAYEIKRSGIAQIAIIPSTGGTPIQITHDDGDSWPFDFSPDGDKVVFAGQRNGLWNIYWVSRTTHVEKQITNYTQPNIYVRYPTWSPKGNQIAYEYAQTTGNIWLMHLK